MLPGHRAFKAGGRQGEGSRERSRELRRGSAHRKVKEYTEELKLI